MLFWTKEEYKLFAEEMMDKPLSYYAFLNSLLVRNTVRELLALTRRILILKRKRCESISPISGYREKM